MHGYAVNSQGEVVQEFTLELSIEEKHYLLKDGEMVIAFSMPDDVLSLQNAKTSSGPWDMLSPDYLTFGYFVFSPENDTFVGGYVALTHDNQCCLITNNFNDEVYICTTTQDINPLALLTEFSEFAEVRNIMEPSA